eukprot:526656_1
MASLETEATGQTKYESVNTNQTQKKKTIYNIIMLVGWVLALIFLICFIVAATKTSNSDSNGDAKNNCDKTTTQSPSTNSPSMAPTTSPVAKNLIIIIGDGMGSSYNTAYRSYKNLSKT